MLEQHVVDDRQGRQRGELFLEVGLETVAVAVDDAVLEPLLDRPPRPVFTYHRGGVDALEQRRYELGERVEVVAAAVVHEVEGDVATRSSILCIGMMRAAWTMAASRPASRHSCRNTLLSTCRIAGLKPKLMFDTPRTVHTPGSSALMRRMPSIVSMPSWRLSSMPVARVSVLQSNRRSLASRP
jgi:hypothetical protein